MDVAQVATEQPADVLRFVIAGSVDDGKSTLIGRLMWETHALPVNELATVSAACRRRGMAQGELDYSLFTDGLKAEREQNITIDVAHRHWRSGRRRFLVLDAPGHEQYIRNMATAASAAQSAVLLVDASRGICAQTRRHALIAYLLGIRRVVLAVNKMDLVEYSQGRFEAIRDEFLLVADRLGDLSVTAVPVCATQGDNLVGHSDRMPWYAGLPLLGVLESMQVGGSLVDGPLRLPVQHVCRTGDSRWYAGTVASGSVGEGDEVLILPSMQTARVTGVLGAEGPVERVSAGRPVSVALGSDLDVGRGSLLCGREQLPMVSSHLRATLVWLDDQPLRRGCEYYIKHTTARGLATVHSVEHRFDVDTLSPAPAEALEPNQAGPCLLTTSQLLVFEPYSVGRTMGAFILIDRLTHRTAAAGMILGIGGA